MRECMFLLAAWGAIILSELIGITQPTATAVAVKAYSRQWKPGDSRFRAQF